MFDAVSESVKAIVDAAMAADWKGLVEAIFATIESVFNLGSSAIGSSEAEAAAETATTK